MSHVDHLPSCIPFSLRWLGGGFQGLKLRDLMQSGTCRHRLDTARTMRKCWDLKVSFNIRWIEWRERR